jgi:hypothetical protein
MKKIDKAWVTTHIRADGKKYYTAYIRLKKKLFWFISIYYTYAIYESIWSDSDNKEYRIGTNMWDGTIAIFTNKRNAEFQLLTTIDKYLDEVQSKLDSEIVSQKSDPVSFGSID